MDLAPLTLKEAQLMEKPVIATDVGGDGEMMIDKKTGFLVKEGNAEEIIQRLGELLGDAEFATKMGKEGAKFVKQEFNWEKVTRNFFSQFLLPIFLFIFTHACLHAMLTCLNAYIHV